jgi:uncharacterized membrane protein
MRQLATYFLRGLLITAPAAVTFYLCWLAIRTIDQVLGAGIPGLGVVAVVVVVTVIGAFASNYVARTLLVLIDQIFERLPFVRLLYTSLKDLLNAFVGEQRRFNRPVRARIGEGEAAIHVLGFVTADSLEHLGLPGHVAVYLPYSYSVAGHVIVVPAERVSPLATDSADAMAFIVSGGVTRTAAPARRR